MQVRSQLDAYQTERDAHLSQLSLMTHQLIDMVSALKDLLRLLLRCSAAATALATPPKGANKQGAPTGPASKANTGRKGTIPALGGLIEGMSADVIASLTNLSLGEVQDLLGGEEGGMAGGKGGAGRNSAAAAAARARCEALVTVLEATLLPVTQQEQGGLGGGDRHAATRAHSGDRWDASNLRLLVSYAEQEVAAVERLVGDV